MPDGILSTALSVWGAVLATSLAAIKIWEVSRERLRLTTSYSFASDPEVGNEIVIENTSKTPVMISYWELVWASKRFFRSTVSYGRFPNEGYCNITIASHSRHVLSFRGPEHFRWGQHPTQKKDKLYLKLYVVGRRLPAWLLVFPKK